MGFLLLRDNHLELTLCFQQAASMSQKRQQEDGKTQSEGNGSDDKRRRVPSLRRSVDSLSILIYFCLVLLKLVGEKGQIGEKLPCLYR